MSLNMKRIDDFAYDGKTVLLRLDINSPIDSNTKKIVNENRIKKSIPTIQKILEKNAKLAIIAHQGDTLDYQNLISLKEHAIKLTGYLGKEVKYIDDVCGPAAQQAVKQLEPSEVIILGNLRYLTEEVSTFENTVKLKAKEMIGTYLVRNLAPLFDFYVNDAFAAAHRNAPSMVAFQELLPTASGELMVQEVSALNNVMKYPKKPCVFVLGGAKISDAFGMMKKVLEDGIADKIITSGITGEIMLLAKGISLGNTKENFINDRGLDVFIKDAQEYLNDYPDKIECPIDLAYVMGEERKEVDIKDLPIEEMFKDIGKKTIQKYKKIIQEANTIFLNGPPGVYEDKNFENGTKGIFEAISEAKGYSVIGGGDSVSAAQKYINITNIDYVCTAGGAMVQYLSGKELPLMKAMKKASK